MWLLINIEKVVWQGDIVFEEPIAERGWDSTQSSPNVSIFIKWHFVCHFVAISVPHWIYVDSLACSKKLTVSG